MLTITEGTDRTGKTSLCGRLAAVLGGEIIHFSAPKTDDPFLEYVGPLASYVPGTGKNVFVDRHYLGELVWAEFFGREPILDDDDAWWIEQYLKSRGAVMILASRNESELEAASVDEPTAGRAVEAQRMFSAAVDTAVLRSGRGWRAYRHGRTINGIINDAGRFEVQVAPVHRHGSSWVGHPTPDVLVVVSRDDDVAGIDHSRVREFCEKQAINPAICTVEIGSGSKFNNVHGIWHALGRPRVAAYGRASARKLTEIGMGLAWNSTDRS